MKRILARWLRPQLLGGVEAEIARLQREIDRQRAALADLEGLRPQIDQMLAAEARPGSVPTAASLQPMIEAMLRRRERERSRRRWRAAAAMIALTGGSALVAWRWPLELARFDPAREHVAHEPAPAAAQVAEPQPAPPALTLVEQREGFGLAQAQRSDTDLAAEVRARLLGCPELAGVELRFSVKDGWIWLRGAAGEGARHAADRALADLGQGVLVVNQIESDGTSVFAER